MSLDFFVCYDYSSDPTWFLSFGLIFSDLLVFSLGTYQSRQCSRPSSYLSVALILTLILGSVALPLPSRLATLLYGLPRTYPIVVPAV